MPEVVSLYTTFANLAEARRIAREAVQGKLSACVNLFPCESVYLWRDQIEEAEEVVAVFKTFRSKCPRLIETIRERSSYESSSVFVHPVAEVSPETLNWLTEVLEVR